jgi:hypothetical protein
VENVENGQKSGSISIPAKNPHRAEEIFARKKRLAKLIGDFHENKKAECREKEFFDRKIKKWNIFFALIENFFPDIFLFLL